MTSTRQQLREARRLFRTCLVDGALDEARVLRVVHRSIEAGGTRGLRMLSRFQRLVRLDRTAHSAHVESATPLSGEIRASLDASLARLYGRGVVTSFVENPALVGGMRVTVGSDVYDGSIRGRLEALEGRF